VPLAPLFFPPVAPTETSHPAPSKGGTDDDDSDRGCVVEDRGIDGGTREGVCTEDRVRPPAPAHEGAAAAAPPEVLQDFQHALEACAAAGESDAGAAAVTLRLLELLLERGELDRVRTMFVVDEPSGGRVESDGSGGSAAGAAAAPVSELGEELFPRVEESKEWSRCVCLCFRGQGVAFSCRWCRARRCWAFRTKRGRALAVSLRTYCSSVATFAASRSRVRWRWQYQESPRIEISKNLPRSFVKMGATKHLIKRA